MSRKNRLSHGLRDWTSKKRSQHFEAIEQSECAIATCYQRATHETPAGLKFCSTHYFNWRDNNPEGGKPVDRTDVYDEDIDDYDEFDDDEFDNEFGHDDFLADQHELEEGAWEDEVEPWKDDLPYGEGWEMCNSEACPFCGKMVDTVYSILSDEVFIAYNALAGIEVWGPADAPKEVVCKGWHKDWEAELIVHFKFTEIGEERLVFLEGKPKGD